MVYHGWEERCMIIRLKPIDAVHSSCSSVHVKNLKTMIFVSSWEDEVAIVRKLDSVRLTDVRNKTFNPTVPTSILHDDNLQLLFWVDNSKASVAD